MLTTIDQKTRIWILGKTKRLSECYWKCKEPGVRNQEEVHDSPIRSCRYLHPPDCKLQLAQYLRNICRFHNKRNYLMLKCSKLNNSRMLLEIGVKRTQKSIRERKCTHMHHIGIGKRPKGGSLFRTKHAHKCSRPQLIVSLTEKKTRLESANPINSYIHR